MPFAPHYRLTLSGDFGVSGQAVEHFSFGLCLALGFPGAAPNGTVGTVGGAHLGLDQAQLDDLVLDCTNFFSRPASHISQYAQLKQVKLAAIGADGKYTDDPYIVATNIMGGGSSSAVMYPPQVAHCVSLGSSTRGASGRGRFYLPMPTSVIGNDLEVSAADRDTVQGSVVQWLNDLQDEPGVDVLGLGVVIASSKGANHQVTKVRMGRTLDTIRSRRRSLPENYGPYVNLA